MSVPGCAHGPDDEHSRHELAEGWGVPAYLSDNLPGQRGCAHMCPDVPNCGPGTPGHVCPCAPTPLRGGHVGTPPSAQNQQGVGRDVVRLLAVVAIGAALVAALTLAVVLVVALATGAVLALAKGDWEEIETDDHCW